MRANAGREIIDGQRDKRYALQAGYRSGLMYLRAERIECRNFAI